MSLARLAKELHDNIEDMARPRYYQFLAEVTAAMALLVAIGYVHDPSWGRRFVGIILIVISAGYVTAATYAKPQERLNVPKVPRQPR